MFANFARLTALVGGAPAFPYTLGDPYSVAAWGDGWVHYRGTSKDETAAPVSIFKIEAKDPSDRKLVLARNGIKRLKMLRHPNVLAFRDSHETTERGETVIYLVTEPVKPLKEVMDGLDLQGQHRNEYLAMGFLHITRAVSFINNDCKLIHGNVCLSALLVTETLDWKLSGFDLLSEHALTGDFALQHSSWMVGAQYKAGELAKCDWDVIRDSPPWAVDAWGLGILMQEVFSGENMQSVDNLRRTDVIPPALLQDYQKLLNSTAARRLNPSKVAESKFLNNRLVEVVAFMENVSLKDSMEKDSFFKKLPSLLPAIPTPVAMRKILPLLSSALEFGGAPAHAVSSLMLIGNKLTSEDFAKRVVPSLAKLFASTDRSLRRSLLESIDVYAPHLSTTVIDDQIFPQLQGGFTDTNAYIRELTLKSILFLAPKMSNKVLTQSVLKHLSRLQVDEEPSIRANTTVLLGNVAQYLGDATCRRVLLNAFTRALKDGFPPAKVAGLRALVATVQYYSAEDAAVRILPAAAPLAIEPIAEVRSAALLVLDTFHKMLRDNDVKMASEAAASGQPREQQAAMGLQGGATGSVLNWAVSSLMSNLSAKPGAPAPSAGSASVAAAPAAAVGNSASASQPTSSSSTPRVPPSKTTPPREAAVKPEAAPRASTSSSKDEGWDDGGGDGDGWNDDDIEVEDDEEVKARNRLSKMTTSKPAAVAPSSRPATSTRPTATTAHVAPPAQDAWEEEADAAARRWDSLDPPAGSTGGTAGAPVARRTAAAKPKAMKLGAQKLGATKIAD